MEENANNATPSPEPKQTTAAPATPPVAPAPSPAPAASPAPENKPAASYDDKGGYGKKGSWVKWLIIYLVIAVVLYGLIIWWYKSTHKSSTNGTTNTGSIY